VPGAVALDSPGQDSLPSNQALGKIVEDAGDIWHPEKVLALNPHEVEE
jgi:hypothetical protein